jgi:alanyl-tRNA synthetase
MRRIELVAGRAAYEYARARNRQVSSLAARLASEPDRLGDSVETLLTELRQARRRSAQLEAELGRVQARALVQSATPVDGTAIVAARVEAGSMDALLGLKDVIREGLGSGIIVLGSLIDGRPQFVASVSPDVIRPDLDAVSLVREVAAVTGGGGGGKPDLARAGGRPELAGKLDDALVRAREIVRIRMAH